MAKTVLKSIGACGECKNELISPLDAEEHELIKVRAYKANALLKPRTKFVVLFGLCVQVLHRWLSSICHEHNLKTKLLLILNANIKSNIFTRCKEHNLLRMFFELMTDFYCYTWITNVNRILKGSCTENINDKIKQQALQFHLKYKRRHHKVKLNT